MNAIKETPNHNNPIAKYDKALKNLMINMNAELMKWIDYNEIKAIVNNNGWTDLQQGDRMHAIYNYICEHFSYAPDIYPKYEPLKAPPYTLLSVYDRHRCNSFDISLALACLLRTAGIKTKFRVIAYKKVFGDLLNHCYVMAYNSDSNQWTPLDVMLGKEGYGNELDYYRVKDFELFNIEKFI